MDGTCRLRRRLFEGSRCFEIEARVAWAPGRAAAPGPRKGARALLRRLGADPENMRRMREILGAADAGAAVAQLDDAAALDRLATLLLSGRAALVEGPPPPSLPSLDVGAADEPPAPTSARAPRAELTWIEIKLIGEDDQGIPGEEYRIDLPDGSVRTGRLDAQGFVRLDGIDPGTCTVTFPVLDTEAWKRV